MVFWRRSKLLGAMVGVVRSLRERRADRNPRVRYSCSSYSREPVAQIRVQQSQGTIDVDNHGVSPIRQKQKTFVVACCCCFEIVQYPSSTVQMS